MGTMNNLYSNGHQHLFQTQCNGLSAAWQRAAQAEHHEHAKSELERPAMRRRHLPVASAAFVVAVLAGVALMSLLSGRGAVPEVQAAPVQQSASAS
jgi:ferric-dicitrate binding protein FerR (iron transport regulator)